MNATICKEKFEHKAQHTWTSISQPTLPSTAPFFPLICQTTERISLPSPLAETPCLLRCAISTTHASTKCPSILSVGTDLALEQQTHTHWVTISCIRNSPQQSRRVCGTCPLPLLLIHEVSVGRPQTSDLRCGHMIQVWPMTVSNAQATDIVKEHTFVHWALILGFLLGHLGMRKPFCLGC